MDLRGEKRQKNQGELDFSGGEKGEARKTQGKETESLRARHEAESHDNRERLMEEICEWKNLKKAIRRVKENDGSAGIDGMRVEELPDYQELVIIREQLCSGAYKPKPVRRVEIQKPDGGMRQLGIPTVLDRVVQQAVMQVLQKQWDPTFSDYSYGFRPGRSAHQAVAQAQACVIEGYSFVVDIDLAKFFDRVNHDRLMAAVAARVSDRRVLRLIRGYLTAGVLDGGLFEESREGTPQGGPLSPLLSNLVLDELDRELERRSHRFVRYADDCNIYVRSEKAGRRVMASLTRFIEGRLKLQINTAKSAVARPWHRSFLGFTVKDDPAFRRCIADKAVTRFKDRVRELTRRHRGISLEKMIADLNPFVRGWAGYFGFSQWRELPSLDGWIRRRLRLRRLGPVED